MKLLSFFRKIFTNKSGAKPQYYNSTVEIPEAKEKIKIVPVGYFPAHHDGAHEITPQNIQEMANNIKNSGTDILFDYGHESIRSSSAKAAGWSDRNSAEAREDGLYIDYPEFNPPALEMIKNKEFRYFSPAYSIKSLNKSGQDIGAILHSIGLVNKPYMDKEINHIGNSQNNNNNNEDNMNPKILKFLGLSESATEAEVEAKLNSLRVNNGLATDASVDDIMTALTAKINSATSQTEAQKSENKTLEDRISALEKQNSEGAIEALVNGAISDGKILPAQKDVYINSAKTDFAKTKTTLDSIAKNSAIPNKVSQPDTSQVQATKPPVYNRAALYEEIKNSTVAATKKN